MCTTLGKEKILPTERRVLWIIFALGPPSGVHGPHNAVCREGVIGCFHPLIVIYGDLWFLTFAGEWPSERSFFLMLL